MLRFEATVAYRHLRSGGGQTLLTVSAVAVGVIAIVFITALIFGAREGFSQWRCALFYVLRLDGMVTPVCDA